MRKRKLIAMILAGGCGNRLGVLTRNIAKPAIPFGGKYRIIDFTLSNCINSDIGNIGVLTQYQPLKLNSYIGMGNTWGTNLCNAQITILPPFTTNKNEEWYRGTANAVSQNNYYIEQFDPEHILILSGDHVYNMDYTKMLEYHKEKGADATISVIEVPLKEASRFGIMNTSNSGRIEQFEEKPTQPKSNLASMGVYIFKWPVLKKFLLEDSRDRNSSHDFGKDIIPKMLHAKQKMYAYRFDGYWKDVGTIPALWKANMDLLGDEPLLNLHDPAWPVYCGSNNLPPQYISGSAVAKDSIISCGCRIYGCVEHSVIFPGVYIGKNSIVKDSIIMPGTRIGNNVNIYKSIIGEKVQLGDGSKIGYGEDIPNQYQPDIYNSGITVIWDGVSIEQETWIGKNVVVDMNLEGIHTLESGQYVSATVKAG